MYPVFVEILLQLKAENIFEYYTKFIYLVKNNKLIFVLYFVWYNNFKYENVVRDFMNLEEKSYIEQQVTNRGKSTAVSYVLWFF